MGSMRRMASLARAASARVLGAWLLAGAASSAAAQDTAASAAPQPPAAARIAAVDPRPMMRPVPVVFDRLRVADIGLVVNLRDPYSVAVGAHYAAARGLAPQQVLRVELPVHSVISPLEFEALRSAIDSHFGHAVQAVALAWVAPYAVNCNSLGGALALGYDEDLCQNSCLPSRASPYANARTARPWSDLRLRLAMHLAAPSVAQAKAMIDRGVRADGRQAQPGAGPAQALFISTADGARNVRSVLYPEERSTPLRGVALRRVQGRFHGSPGA
jgi:uncharacterized protein (TIGR03790 family)